MQAEVKDMCLACGKCAQFKSQNSKEPMNCQPIPEYPWQFVSQDLCSFESGSFLVTVDHYSDFIEVDELNDTLSSTVTAKTEAHITRHGVPEIILTDNGPQFIASEYAGLCDRYHMHHITSSPYWPQGNGKAESAVKILKRIMKKSGKPNLYAALLNYRNTPPQGHTLSPAQRSMGRRTRGQLPISRHLLVSSAPESLSVQDSISRKRESAKRHYDKNKGDDLPPLRVGDFAYLKPPPHKKASPWYYGVVTDIPSPRSYIVETPTGVTRRNRAHVRPAAPPPPGALIPRAWQKHFASNMRAAHGSPQVNSADPVGTRNKDTASPIPVSTLLPNTNAAELPPTLEQSLCGCVPSTATTPGSIKNSSGSQCVITRSGRISHPVERLDL